MNDKALEAIRTYDMLHPGDRVLVGLSGGADSCALLHFLCSLRDTWSLTIYACHINHGIRGENADKDENFTRNFCESLDVPLYVFRTDVRAEAKRRKIGLEQCGRDVRYDFFNRKAEELNSLIATAHTASDQTETVLLNLTRGSGLYGLCGIPPVRGNIIRPLITSTREEIEDYCRRFHLAYVTDESNLMTEFSRNRVRLQVMPVLREINPAVVSAVSACSRHLQEAGNFLRIHTKRALEEAAVPGGYRTEALRTWHPAVFSCAVRMLCEEYARIPSAVHIELMKKIVYNGGAVEIDRELFAVSSQGIFRVVRKQAAFSSGRCPLDPPNSAEIHDKKFSLSLVNIEEFNNRQKKEKFLFQNALDYDTIPLTSVFRTRQGGDCFTLCRRNVTKPVRRLMMELKIPREQRDAVVLLASGHQILWMEGVGPSRDCMVTEQTKTVLVIVREPESGK